MNTFDLTPMAARPSLEQYRKQAKDFVKLVSVGDSGSLRRIEQWHPRADHLLGSSGSSAEFTLADGQWVIAREHGFHSWPKFAAHIAELAHDNSSVSRFEAAADAIVSGELTALRALLLANPELVHARSARLHRATLLHYIGANGFENYRQKSPANAVEIARALLEAGADANALADIYGQSTTLGLVASSIHPKKAGVQISLMETLLEYGANIDGVESSQNPLLAALHNGRGQASEFLARRGARLDLEGAAGVGFLEAVERFFQPDGSLKAGATRAQMQAGFLWACEYGYVGVMEFLLEKGVELDTEGVSGLTGLHWAVVGGRLSAVELLLQRGAPLEVRNVYGATVLGQALWSACNGDSETDYVPILRALIDAGAKVEDGSRDWLLSQPGGSSLQKARLIDILGDHGAG